MLLLCSLHLNRAWTISCQKPCVKRGAKERSRWLSWDWKTCKPRKDLLHAACIPIPDGLHIRGQMSSCQYLCMRNFVMNRAFPSAPDEMACNKTTKSFKQPAHGSTCSWASKGRRTAHSIHLNRNSPWSFCYAVHSQEHGWSLVKN